MMDLIPEWLSFKNSLVSIQTSPSSLVLIKLKNQKNILPWARQEGLVWKQTKESNWSHFGIRFIRVRYTCQLLWSTVNLLPFEIKTTKEQVSYHHWSTSISKLSRKIHVQKADLPVSRVGSLPLVLTDTSRWKDSFCRGQTEPARVGSSCRHIDELFP